jgi:hypothetical protein
MTNAIRTAQLIQALARIVGAQQERIDRLERRLDSRQKSSDTGVPPDSAHNQLPESQP